MVVVNYAKFDRIEAGDVPHGENMHVEGG
jgi:hypothetical protein